MGIFKSAPKIAARIFAIVLGILIFVYLGVSVMIGWGVNKESRSAMAQFKGDRVEALIALVDCRDCRLEDRNHAVWALGQLKDKQALPVMYKYRTGKPCNHSTAICQYELEKAIRWTEGKSHMLPQIWRVMLRDEHRSAARSDPGRTVSDNG
jgi:hypothetical protein